MYFYQESMSSVRRGGLYLQTDRQPGSLSDHLKGNY